MSGKPFVRRGTRDDIDAILELDRASEQAPHWARHFYEDIVRHIEDSGMEIQNSGLNRALFVAESVGLVGFVVVTVVAGEAELESVVVGNGDRRRGLGKALCLKGMEWARTAGAQQMRLEVRAWNTGALALYRTLGFTQTGVRPGYYAAPAEDAVQMAAQLNAADL